MDSATYKNGKINAIVIGIGHHHADDVVQALKEHCQYNLLGYYEQDEITLKEKKYTDLYKDLTLYKFNEIISNKTIQAIFIEAPAELQVYYAKKFFSLRVPIHFDKPVGTDVNEMKELFLKMRKDNILFQIGYMYRYNPAVLEMKRRIDRGELGKIYNIEAVMNTENNRNFREWLSKYSGGSMFILGCHMIDIVYSIMGKPISIYPFSKKSGRDAVNANDSCSVIFEYKRGIANIQATCVEAGGYGRRRIIVSGEKASIEIQPIENPTQMFFSKLDYSKSYSSHDKDKISLSNYTVSGRYTYMLDDFVSIVKNEMSALYFVPDYDYEIELQNLIIQSFSDLN